MKRISAMLLCICLILSLCIPVNARQHSYSTSANSGVRHEICTTLDGTRADDYYTGTYTYENLSELSSSQLLSTLRTLLTSTHTHKASYNDCRDKAVKTDCENGDGVTVSLLYTSYVATWDDWCNNRPQGWNREHVWPKNLGNFDDSETPGCDLHHVRPSDQPINSARSNKKYGNVSGGTNAYGASYTGRALGGTYSGNYFEPLDNVKGDVARICLYMYVRYGGDSEYTCGSITNVFQSVDVLLQWCEMDPVDTWEMGRNEVVASIQGNRNVFIDYPELAWVLFGKEIPDNMTTPSGNAKNSGGSSASCNHDRITVRNASDATCAGTGYTGDTYCSECGVKLSSGSSIPALGHLNENGDSTCDRCGTTVECGHGETEVRDILEANCGTDGYSGDTYCLHCELLLERGEAVLATGDHSFGDWATVKEATVEAAGLEERTCSVCGYAEQQETPKLEPVTDPTEQETSPSETETEPTTGSDRPTNGDDPDEDSETDYRWLVAVVIGAGACLSIVCVLIRIKRKPIVN